MVGRCGLMPLVLVVVVVLFLFDVEACKFKLVEKVHTGASDPRTDSCQWPMTLESKTSRFTWVEE